MQNLLFLLPLLACPLCMVVMMLMMGKMMGGHKEPPTPPMQQPGRDSWQPSTADMPNTSAPPEQRHVPAEYR